MAEVLLPSLETISAPWRSAFDAAASALRAADASLEPAELRDRSRRLGGERAATVALLDAVARAEGVPARFSELLLSPAALKRLLGLPSTAIACVFDLEGVLVGSAAIHAAAWRETFDELIHARVEQTGGRFAPFDPRTDYPRHIHGRPRLEGVRAFLASRGISLPEGAPSDPPGAGTVHALANRKQEALLRRLDERGVRAFEGSKRYLETARDAGLRRAVVSASTHTDTILERAGLAGLVERSVDGSTIVAERLRPSPAPDALLAACRMLDVDPAHAVAFQTTADGVAAARTAGFGLVVATGLADLLDRSSKLRWCPPASS